MGCGRLFVGPAVTGDLSVFPTGNNPDRKTAEELKAFANLVSYPHAVLTDASSEDQQVEAAQHCCIRCNRLADRCAENLDRHLRL